MKQDQGLSVGDIVTFNDPPGFWRCIGFEGDQPRFQKIEKREAEQELQELALMRRLGQRCAGR